MTMLNVFVAISIGVTCALFHVPGLCVAILSGLFLVGVMSAERRGKAEAALLKPEE